MGVGSHSLLQGIFPTHSPALWADSWLCEIYPQSYTDFVILCYLNSTHVHPSPQRINSCLSFLLQGIFMIHVAELWKSSSKRGNTELLLIKVGEKWFCLLGLHSPMEEGDVENFYLEFVWILLLISHFHMLHLGEADTTGIYAHICTQGHFRSLFSPRSLIHYVKVQKCLSTSPQWSGNGPEFGIRSHLYKVSSWPFSSFAYQEDSYLLSWKLVSHF